MVAALRIVLALSGLTALALSTFLYARVGRPLASAWWRRFTPPGREPPALFMDPRIQRAWGVTAGVGNLGIAWYLGTPAGAALLDQMLGARMVP